MPIHVVNENLANTIKQCLKVALCSFVDRGSSFSIDIIVYF